MVDFLRWQRYEKSLTYLITCKTFFVIYKTFFPNRKKKRPLETIFHQTFWLLIVVVVNVERIAV